MAATVPEERATAVGAGFGSLLYFCGGLAFGIGFGRPLSQRARHEAAAAGSFGGDGSA